MKGVIMFGLLSVAFVGVCSDLISNKESDLLDKCVQQTGVDVNNVNKDVGETLKNLQDGKLGCFLGCFLKELGIMHDGDIDINSKKYPPFEETKECGSLRGKDECDTADKVVECILKKEIEMGFRV